MNAITIQVICMLFSWQALAQNTSGEAISLNFENDSRSLGGPGSDDEYTSGFRLSYVLTQNEVPGWVSPFFNLIEGHEDPDSPRNNIGFSVGQQLYTPNDTQNPNLIIGDRPYAAWLYFAVTAQIQKKSHIQIYELDLGYVGPEALGETAQNGIHRIIGDQSAKGWANQLGSEPTLQLFYQQREKFYAKYYSEENKYFDIIPYFGGSFGNVAIDAHIGGLVRFGTHLPGDFGPTGTSSKNGDSFAVATKDTLPTSLYVFAGGRLTAVGHDIFLDGNTFHSSYHVTKVPLVHETELGVGCVLHRWEFSWSFVVRSPQFVGQDQFDEFASISISHSL